jgi:hypothetical protein
MPEEEVRAEFEKWALSSGLYDSPRTGNFQRDAANGDFPVWQASRRTAFDRAVEIVHSRSHSTLQRLLQALAEERDKG